MQPVGHTFHQVRSNDTAEQIAGRAKHWATVCDGHQVVGEPALDIRGSASSGATASAGTLISPLGNAGGASAAIELPVARSTSPVAKRPSPLSMETARTRAKTLHRLASRDSYAATTAALKKIGMTARAREKRAKSGHTLPTLVDSTRKAIMHGHLETARALWDSCTWAEWTKVATFSVQRTSHAQDSRRQLIFDLSTGSDALLEKLFPCNDEHNQRAEEYLRRQSAEPSKYNCR